MEDIEMDPYEQQLYSVFKNYDRHNSGCLGRKSLIELCNTLQLEEKGNNLVANLLKNPNDSVTFTQFRDGLLNVLGAGNENSKTEILSEDESSGREVSPRYVYGTKKYGRRSKPQTSVSLPCETQDNESDIEISPNTSFKIQRSQSNKEIGDKKRSNKVKKNLSFSDKKTIRKSMTHSDLDKATSLDHDKLINYSESLQLCRTMHMDKVDSNLLEQIFEDHADLDAEGRITVGDFFHHLNKKLITSITSELNIPSGSVDDLLSDNVYTSVEDVSRNHNINVNELIMMWHQAGIDKCQQMLDDLGFYQESIDLNDLSRVLDEEIRIAISTTNISSHDTTSVLLQASLCLHRYELKCIKKAMDQLFGENTKIKNDLNEANHRATLLAQEVDDNHTKMEATLKLKIQQLEQKHAELVKDICESAEHDRDAANLANNIVKEQEEKITALQIDENRLKNQYTSLKEKNDTLEKQLCAHNEIITELEEIKMQLTKDVKILAKENAMLKTYNERDRSETNQLVQQIEKLQVENQSLRDKNDELTVEIDRISKCKPQYVEMSCGQPEAETGENVWDLMVDLRGGVKRRGDSPSKGRNFEDESPRIGKVRKCNKNGPCEYTSSGDSKNSDGSAFPYTASESGLECDLDSSSDASLSIESPAIAMTSSLIQTNQKLSISDAVKLRESLLSILRTMYQIKDLLERNINEQCDCCKIVKKSMQQGEDNLIAVENFVDSGNISLHNELKKIFKQINHVDCQTESPIVNLEAFKELENKLECERKQHENERTKLEQRYRELEYDLEQLKIEYDKSEEYWLNKLDEEKEIFNEEQRLSDERLNDLISKISEFEEQFSPKGKNGLPTIEEKCSLEMQFTDLEEEYECFKNEKNREIDDKNKEIALLKEQLRHFERVKIESLADSPQEKASSPIEYLWNQGTIDSPFVKNETIRRDYQNPAFIRNHNKSNTNNDISIQSAPDNEKENSINPIKKPDLPKRSSSVEVLNSPSVETKEFPKKWNEEKKVNGTPTMIQCSDLEGELRKNSYNNSQPNQDRDRATHWSSLGEMNRNIEMTCIILEQRNRHLQKMLFQQQMYTDNLQKTVRTDVGMLQEKLINAESVIKDLQNRLTSADLLVKDLYVENCQLAGTQRIPKML